MTKREPLWRGHRVHPLLHGALSAARGTDRPSPPYHQFSPRPVLGHEDQVLVALDLIERVLPFLREEERSAVTGSVALARKAIEAWEGESLQVVASRRIDAATLGAIAEMLAWRSLDDEGARTSLRGPLRRCGELCIELLYRRGAGDRVPALCAALDDELMRREVRSLAKMQENRDSRFERVQRVICTGGTATSSMWRQRWFFVELDDEEEAVFVWDDLPFQARAISGRSGTLLGILAADSFSASLARSISRALELRTLARAFSGAFPEDARILVGTAQMLIGVDSGRCDFCSLVTRRRWPSCFCFYCRETVEAALGGRRVDPPMFLALAARALSAIEPNTASATLSALDDRLGSGPIGCPFCDSMSGESLLACARGVICRRCVNPRQAPEDLDRGR